MNDEEKTKAVLEEFSDVWVETFDQLDAMAYEIVTTRSVRDYWMKRAERAEAVVTELNARIEGYGEGEV